jgi:hypothetical protein
MHKRRHYITQEELNAAALNSRHPKQAKAAAEYIAAGWHVYQTITDGGGSTSMIVFLQHGEMFGVMYPNGRCIGPAVGKRKVRLNWKDIRAAASMDGTLKLTTKTRETKQDPELVGNI